MTVAGHTFTEWRYIGMGDSKCECLTCGFEWVDLRPETDVPPCPKPAEGHIHIYREASMTYLAKGDILVLETEDDVFLGALEVRKDALVVHTGFRGHPRLVPWSEVMSVHLAVEHPDCDA